MTAMELCHQRKRVVKISTGSKQFDSILGGFVYQLLLGILSGRLLTPSTAVSRA